MCTCNVTHPPRTVLLDCVWLCKSLLEGVHLTIQLGCSHLHTATFNLRISAGASLRKIWTSSIFNFSLVNCTRAATLASRTVLPNCVWLCAKCLEGVHCATLQGCSREQMVASSLWLIGVIFLRKSCTPVIRNFPWPCPHATMSFFLYCKLIRLLDKCREAGWKGKVCSVL